MPHLFIYPKKGGSYSFVLGETKISIGRSSKNELVLDDHCCSGSHAVVFASGEEYFIRDVGSKNGTFVNEQKISKETRLVKGNEIKIGSTIILFDQAKDAESSDSETFTQTIMRIKDILEESSPLEDREEAVGPGGAVVHDEDHKARNILKEVSEALIYFKPLDEYLDHIMNLIIRHIPMDRGILMLKEGDSAELKSRVVKALGNEEQIARMTMSESIVRTALAKQSAILISDIQSDQNIKDKDSIVRSKIHTAMCVPLWNNEEIIGVIYCHRISVVDPFRESDLKLLTLLANLAAARIREAIQQAEIRRQLDFKKQLELAKKTQEGFLPKKDPVFESFDISGSMRACYLIGGDYYDFIPLDPSRMGIAIADVSGVGGGAALLMAHMSGSLYTETRVFKNLADLTATLNESVQSRSEINSFISFFMGIVDREKEEMVYVNAGHNPPFLINSSGEVQALDSTGLCLGMFSSARFETASIAFRPGDLLCLYTDGIVESRREGGEEFGEDRLIETLKNAYPLPSRHIMNKIYEAVFMFSKVSEPEDDMTLVVLKKLA